MGESKEIGKLLVFPPQAHLLPTIERMHVCSVEKVTACRMGEREVLHAPLEEVDTVCSRRSVEALRFEPASDDVTGTIRDQHEGLIER